MRAGRATFELVRVDARTWARWWKRQGEAELILLLWALWDPIGYRPPLDEYANYAPRLAHVLRERRPPEEIPSTLRAFRDEIGVLPDDQADLHTAWSLSAWYGWHFVALEADE